MKSRIYLKIPLERTGVLIGNKGSTKAEIEKSTGTNICVDGKTGEVVIEGSPNYKDPSGILKAKDLINAIARGFSPERAFRLFSDGQILDVIDLKEILGDSRNQLIRVKGRVIGEKGKTRRIIENLTNTYISIYGHTIAIIGDYEEVRVAKEAIEMLLKGMQHGTVYRFLNRKHMDLKKRELSLWEEKPQLREEA
ncbi:MAG: RNA-processing protein [Candidatus Methanomethyliales bacterium]|nr:RNA-processing protein [Candidatus Methanomethylicales archaeon]